MPTLDIVWAAIDGVSPLRSAANQLFRVGDGATDPASPPIPPPTLRIAGYIDGTIAGCTGSASSDPAWNGTMPEARSVILGATGDYTLRTTWESAGGLLSIDGKQFEGASVFRETAAGKWLLWIGLFGEFWQGEKDGLPNGPEGVYARTGGCDTTASLTVERY
jgi:hypothetical protein